MAERFLGSIRRISLTTWLATNKDGYSAAFDSDGLARRWFLQGTAEKSYGLAGIRFDVGANGITLVTQAKIDNVDATLLATFSMACEATGTIIHR